jgi:hypothetical protein
VSGVADVSMTEEKKEKKEKKDKKDKDEDKVSSVVDRSNHHPVVENPI